MSRGSAVRHPLLERLRSADPGERAAACRAVVSDPAGALLAEPLVAALGDRERPVAKAALEAAVALARSSEGVLPLLRQALRRSTGSARIHAALALARLEPPAPGLLPALVDGLAARDGDLRWAVTRVLVDLGRLHPEVIGLLLGLVRQGPDAATRRMASFALRALAPDVPAAAQVLLAATRDDDAQVRRAAVTALAGLVAAPPEVAARLAELLDDPDPVLAGLAALALAELAGGTGDASLAERVAAAEARAATPALRQALARARERIAGRHDPEMEATR